MRRKRRGCRSSGCAPRVSRTSSSTAGQVRIAASVLVTAPLTSAPSAGLLLDLNHLAPSASQNSPPSYAAATNPFSIPSNPHALLSPDLPSYPHAVNLYRSLLTSIATDHAHRRAMGSAAHLVASKRSWWRAMEDLCDGFRELAALKAQRTRKKVELTRTSTIEVDVVCDKGDDHQVEKVEPAAASSRAPKPRRLLRGTSSAGRHSLSTWLAPRSATSLAGAATAIKGDANFPIGAFQSSLRQNVQGLTDLIRQPSSSRSSPSLRSWPSPYRGPRTSSFSPPSVRSSSRKPLSLSHHCRAMRGMQAA